MFVSFIFFIKKTSAQLPVNDNPAELFGKNTFESWDENYKILVNNCLNFSFFLKPFGEFLLTLKD